MDVSVLIIFFVVLKVLFLVAAGVLITIGLRAFRRRQARLAETSGPSVVQPSPHASE